MLSPSALNLNLMSHAGREAPRQYVKTVDGPQLACTDEGDGPPVVLIHGTLTALEDMTIALGDALRPNYRVVAFDRPGCGKSERRRFVDAGLFAQARRLWEGLDALDVSRPVLVGHSLGASVALAMGLVRPNQAAGVVAIAPLVFPEPRMEHLVFAPRAPAFSGLATAAALAPADKALFPLLWRAMFLPQMMPDRFQDEFPFPVAGDVAAAMRVGEDALAALPDLARLSAGWLTCATPVRVVGGDRDLVVRNGAHGRLLAALAPDGAFIDLPGLGHMAHHFAPDVIAATIAELTARDRGEAPANS